MKGWIFGILGIGAVAAYLLAKGTSIVNFAQKLTISPRLNGKPELRNGGGSVLDKIASYITGSAYLKVPLAVVFENRSDEEMTVGVSALMAYYKDSIVAKSTPGVSSVRIKGHAKTTLEGVYVEIPTTKLVSLIGASVESLLINKNFDEILNNLKIEITAILNDTFSFDVTIPLNQSAEVNANNSKSVNGLGLAAASKRKIGPLTDYIAYIPDKSLLLHHDYIVKANGSVEDTAAIMHKAASADKENVRELAERLRKDTLPKTLQSIFDFVYGYIQYELDSRITEQVRRPLRTLYDQKGDCDCYATLIASMLEALNIDYKFRIAAYSAGRYQHVYVIVPTSSGYYVVDPVLDNCFSEKPFTKKLDL